MNWLYYLAEANLYLCVFYLAYCSFLAKETHYQLNRTYLLTMCIIAFIIPLIQVNALKRPQPVSVDLVHIHQDIKPIVGASPSAIHNNGFKNVVSKGHVSVQSPSKFSVIKPQPQHYTVGNMIKLTYITGVALAFILFIIKLIALFKLAFRTNRVTSKYKIIYVDGENAAFSFFNYLFIGTKAIKEHAIIEHEEVHIRQKHSADILFLELLRIVCWFNPCIYLLQRSLKTVHEYIADEIASGSEANKLDYSSFLISQAYGTETLSITHSFYNYNLLKKRITMLNQQRSGKLARLKYLVFVPIAIATLCTSTLAFSKTYGWINISSYTKKQTEKRIPIYSLNNKVGGLLLNAKNIPVKHIDKNDDEILPLPVVNRTGYLELEHQMYKSTQYNPSKEEKGGLVVVRLSINADRHIKQVEIVKSGGEKLDKLVLNALNGFRGILNDDPNKVVKLGIYFFNNNYNIFNDPYSEDPEFGGEMIITKNHTPNVTTKGYEYEESISVMPYAPDEKSLVYGQVVIYDKGQAHWYESNKLTPETADYLQRYYGYVFPSATTPVIKMIEPVKSGEKTLRLATIYNVFSYLKPPYATDFYNALSTSIKYPPEAKQQKVSGLVMLGFSVDDSGLVGNVKILKDPGNGFAEAAAKALEEYKGKITGSLGEHTLAVAFCISDKENRPAVPEALKKEAYIGVLSISDVPSPFTMIKGGMVLTPVQTTPKN